MVRIGLRPNGCIRPKSTGGGYKRPLFALDNNSGFGTVPVTATLDGHVYDIGMNWLSAGYVAASTPGVHTGTFDANIGLFGLPGDEAILTVGRGTISATWGYVTEFGEQVLTVVSPVNYTFKNVPEPSTLA